MADFTKELPAGFEQFSNDADFIWDCALHFGHLNIEPQQFIDSLGNAISYLNSLSMEQVKRICNEGDMAEKISIIVDLKDYAYEALLRDWNQGS